MRARVCSRAACLTGLLVLLALLAPGCSGSPDVHYYALETSATEASPAAGGPLEVVVGPVRVPRFLERGGLTWRSGPSALVYDENHRWAASLDAEVARVVGEQVARGLGGDVVTWPATGTSATALQVTIDVEALDVRLGAPSRLRARCAVLRGGASPPTAAFGVTAEATLDRGRPAHAVATYSKLVGALAQQIVERLSRLR